MDTFDKVYCGLGILLLIFIIWLGFFLNSTEKQATQFCKDNGYEKADNGKYCYKYINDTLKVKEYVVFGTIRNQTRVFLE